MRKVLLLAAVAAPMLAAVPAQAGLISIGLQEDGTNGGAITTVASGAGSAIFSATYGTFDLNQISATGSPFMPEPGLASGSIQTTSAAAGSINVFITEQGLGGSGVPASFLSSFTSNLFGGNAVSVVETTYVSAANALYTGTQLATHTFTGIGTSTSTNTIPGLTSPYSETIEYTITVGAGGANVNDTVNLGAGAAVPEPASWAMMIAGFGLVGGALRRRQSLVTRLA